MDGGITERDEKFLRAAEQQGLLSAEHVFILRREKVFYPDMSVGQVAVVKGFMDEGQVESIYRAADEEGAVSEPGAAESATAGTGAAPESAEQAVAQGSSGATDAVEAHGSPTVAVVEEKEAEAVAPEEEALIADERVQSLRTLEDYLGFARDLQASDLHLSAGYRPYVRRFGLFRFFDRAPFEQAELDDLLLPALTEEQRRQLAEKCSLECGIDIEGQGRYRTTIVRHRLGWDATFRVVSSKVPTVEELGLPEVVLRLADFRQGMVLVTGPGGCGKTTTMAALVEYINRTRSDHILTLEKPIEYVFEPKKAHITQRQVGFHTASYHRGLLAALREDPDVILLGEMRDLETISMAVTAAETGHLIVATLHTTTAARTISRILDSYPPDQQPQIRLMLAESLRGVICQQLVPRIDGQGLALAVEVLVVTPGVSSLIREMKIHQVATAFQSGKRLGMVRMDDSLMALYRQGIISIEEAYARADDKRMFAPLLSR